MALRLPEGTKAFIEATRVVAATTKQGSLDSMSLLTLMALTYKGHLSLLSPLAPNEKPPPTVPCTAGGGVLQPISSGAGPVAPDGVLLKCPERELSGDCIGSRAYSCPVRTTLANARRRPALPNCC